MKVKSLKRVLSFIDPLFGYIVVVYGLSRAYQRFYDVESVWQTFWDRLQGFMGKKV